MARAADRDTPHWAYAILESPATALVARVVLTLPYWWSGLTKLTHWSDAITEAAGMGFAMPAAVVVIGTIVVQLAGSMLVIANRYVWLGAGALAVFTMLATLIAHAYWRVEGVERIAQMNIFLEHMGLIAAFVLVSILSTRGHDASR